MYSVLEKKKKKKEATFHLKIGSVKTVITEEWNKIFEEFFLKACKSFRRRVEKMIEKKKKKW